jgi:hypothetical protein
MSYDMTTSSTDGGDDELGIRDVNRDDGLAEATRSHRGFGNFCF